MYVRIMLRPRCSKSGRGKIAFLSDLRHAVIHVTGSRAVTELRDQTDSSDADAAKGVSVGGNCSALKWRQNDRLCFPAAAGKSPNPRALPAAPVRLAALQTHPTEAILLAV